MRTSASATGGTGGADSVRRPGRHGRSADEVQGEIDAVLARLPAAERLAFRKRLLRARSAVLRQRFAAQAEVLQPAFWVADRLRDGSAWALHHPRALAALWSALAFARRRGWIGPWRTWWRWLRRGAAGWRVLDVLRGVWAGGGVRPRQRSG